MRRAERWVRAVVGLILTIGGLELILARPEAPLAVLAGLATAVVPLARAWRASMGTALRPAVIWAILAVGIGLVSQAIAWSEPPGSGRPSAGHVTYLTVLTTLAALISVLNARTPGGGAWAILMALLVLVFLIPWLEGPSLARNAQGLGRLRLDTPWSWFFVMVVVAGVTNYLPTRYGPAAAWLGFGLLVEYLALTRAGLRASRGAVLWSVFPWTLAVALWWADARSRRPVPAAGALDASWLWFRDHWGVVWALRVQERFNRSAELQHWPVRLGWDGVLPAPGAGPVAPPVADDPALATFRMLLRRFADPTRIVGAVAGDGANSCDPGRTG